MTISGRQYAFHAALHEAETRSNPDTPAIPGNRANPAYSVEKLDEDPEILLGDSIGTGYRLRLNARFVLI